MFQSSESKHTCDCPVVHIRGELRRQIRPCYCQEDNRIKDKQKRVSKRTEGCGHWRRVHCSFLDSVLSGQLRLSPKSAWLSVKNEGLNDPPQSRQEQCQAGLRETAWWLRQRTRLHCRASWRRQRVWYQNRWRIWRYSLLNLELLQSYLRDPHNLKLYSLNAGIGYDSHADDVYKNLYTDFMKN